MALSTLPYLITSATTITPPGSPANTAHYIVPTGATGAWSGQTNNITWYENSAWSFATPPSTGMEVFVLDQGNIYVWNNTSWNLAISTPINRVAVADANYVVTATSSVIVAYTSITAARTITLPSANLSGQLVWIIDESGSVTSTLSLTIQRAGSDLIEGQTSIALLGGYSAICLESSGSGAWTVQTYEELPIAVADAGYTVLFKEDCIVQMNTLTAARIINLPTATITGQRVTVADYSGNCNSTKTITITPNGSNTINGVNASVVFNSAYEYATFISNGSGAWIYDSSGLIIATQLATVQPTAVAAAIGPWTAYTPVWTASGTAPSLGNGTLTGFYRRVGDSAEIQIQMLSGTTTTFGTGTYYFSIPSGLLIDTTKLFASGLGDGCVGIAVAGGTNTNLVMSTGVASTTTLEAISGTTYMGPSAVTYSGAGCTASLHAIVPITTYSSNINLLTNFTEYAFNNSATTANDTTSFGYGSAGFAIQNFAPTGNTGIQKRVQFTQAIKTTDLLILELNNGSGWFPNTFTLGAELNSTTALCGAIVRASGALTADVYFYSTAVADGTTWATINTWLWRVRKISQGNFAQGSPSYSQTFGDGSSTSYTITHNLGTSDLNVSVWELTGSLRQISSGIQVSNGGNNNQITITTSTAPALNSLRCDVFSSGGTVAAGDRLSTIANTEIQVSSATTATLRTWHNCTSTSANYALTLPAAASCSGQFIGIRIDPTSTYTVTVTGNASELIDGLNTRVMWANEVAELKSNGVGWTKVAGKSIPMTASLGRSSTAQTFANSTNPALTNFTVTLSSTAPTGFIGSSLITALRPGQYRASLRTLWTTNNSSTCQVYTYIFKEVAGTNMAQGLFIYPASGWIFGFINALVTLATGNYLQPYGYYTAGSFTTNFLYDDSGSGNQYNQFIVEEIPTW